MEKLTAIELPCMVGDTVYWLNNWFVERASGLTNDEWHITESRASMFFFNSLGLFIKLSNGENIATSEIGKTIFFAKKKAKAALKARMLKNQST